jgi:hypothetical protein
MVFLVVTPYSLVNTDVSKYRNAFIVRNKQSKNGLKKEKKATICRNVGNLLVDTASHSTGLECQKCSPLYFFELGLSCLSALYKSQASLDSGLLVGQSV